MPGENHAPEMGAVMTNLARSLGNGVGTLTSHDDWQSLVCMHDLNHPHGCCQAPAAELRRHARAVLEELPVHLRPRALQQYAGSSKLNTAERDLLRLLKAHGLMLPLGVSSFSSGPHRIAHIKLATWFRYQLNVANGRGLLGGFGCLDHEGHMCLRAYWEAFAKEQPTHAALALHAGQLHRVIPYALHLDEGRGLRKSAVMVLHAQTIFGAETSQRFRDRMQEWNAHLLSNEQQAQLMLESQFHNGRGSTFRTRMLYTCLPKAIYTKGNSHVFDKLMEVLGQECTDLLEDGLTVADGSKFWFALVAVKGDAPALVKAGGLIRNFQCLGNGICFECRAGEAGVPFEDCRAHPVYERTIFRVRPWINPSPLAMVPGNPEAPERLFHRDPFHVYKQCVGGAYVASSIVLISELGYFDIQGDNNFDALMARMFADFTHYVKHESGLGLVSHIKHFTRTNLHYPRAQSFPYARLKGGDIMLLTRWLRHLILHGPRSNVGNGGRTGNMMATALEQWHGPLLRNIATAAAGAIRFFHILHRHGLWLNRELGQDLGASALQFCSSYSALASGCFHQRLHRFSLVPSLHYYHHFYMDVKIKLQNRAATFLSSPSLANCEGDEDFIGKISRLSRHVHAAVTNSRTIDRYLVKLHFVLERGED